MDNHKIYISQVDTLHGPQWVVEGLVPGGGRVYRDNFYDLLAARNFAQGCCAALDATTGQTWVVDED